MRAIQLRPETFPTLPAHTLTSLAAVIGASAALEIPTMIKGALLGIAAILVVAGRSVSAVSIVCLSLPLVMIGIPIGQTEWSPLELALLACWLSTGVEGAQLLLAKRDTRQLLWPPDLALLACGFALVGALSLLWVVDSGPRSDSLRELRRVILEPLILVPAIALLRRRGSEYAVLPWVVVPAVAVALLSAGQLALQTSVVEIGRIARPIGTFTHPNNLAFYLERVIWFAPLLVFSRIAVPRYARWGGAAIIAGGCLLTFSRGALAALVVGGAVYLWERVRPNWRRYMTAVAAAGALFVFSRALFGGVGSTGSRMTIWRASIEMLRDHPIRGVGLDQFLGQYGRRYVEPAGWPERYTSHPHNIALDFWLRLGLPGIALFWALIELSTRRISHSLAGQPLTLHRAAVAMLVAGFVHGLIDNGFFLADLASFTWIGLAFASPGASHGDDRDV